MRYNLSEINELIKDRRTIYPRNYSQRKVHKEQIEVLLNNAIWAPSHKLTQPWRFHVFMEEGKTKLGDFMREQYINTTPEEQQKASKLEKIELRTRNASAIIAVCMKRDEEERIPEIEEIAAVSCAIQNMFLTCTAYGLGGFWSTSRTIYSEAMNTFLGLTKKDKCLGLFYVGYPAEKWPKSRRKPIEYVTEWTTE